MLLAASNVIDVAVAAVAALPAVAAVVVSTKQQNRKLDKVSKSVETSNGKTAGNYIEDVWHRFEQMEVDQTVLLRQILDHSDSVSRRFESLDHRLRRLEALRNGNNLD